MSKHHAICSRQLSLRAPKSAERLIPRRAPSRSSPLFDISSDLLALHGWNDRCTAHFADQDPQLQVARIVHVERDRATAVTASGFVTVMCDLMASVGDWVGLTEAGDTQRPHVVSHVMAPWSRLTRLDPASHSHHHDTMQVLASNIDVVFLTVPLGRRLSAKRIEREQLAVWDSGARPIVLLTKADRHPDPGEVATDLLDRMVGAEVIVTAAVAGHGIAAVRDILSQGITGLMLGASGAGKSTLSNALIGADVMSTGDVRLLDARGKHTTTSRHLFAVPTGGVLIDSPGIRSLGLANDASASLDAVFADIVELAAQCRFSDCAHDTEPGCAVRSAVDDGELAADRLVSWRKLGREVAALERRSDPLAQAAERALWKQRTKQYRTHPKYQKR